MHASTASARRHSAWKTSEICCAQLTPTNSKADISQFLSSTSTKTIPSASAVTVWARPAWPV